MKLTIKLFAHYRENRFKVAEKAFREGVTAREVIADLGLDTAKYPLGILLVNGSHVEEDHILKDGDVLSIFPKVGGG